MMNQNITNKEYDTLIGNLKNRIITWRHNAAFSANKELIFLYHNIGIQILEAQAKQGWGSNVIEQLSKDLSSAFPEMKGFGVRNLKYMRKFSKEYQEDIIVQEVLAQLPWYHHVTLLDKIKERGVRFFYIKKPLNMVGLEI